MQTLTFQNISLTPAKIDSQIWLTSADIAQALGYARSDSVTRLYRENADEFRSDTTQIIKTNVKGFGNGNSEKEIRIFSLRGCHLIAMFARTKVAKQFRQWVLDILDKEVGQPVVVHTTTDDRTTLRQAVSMLVSKKGLPYDQAYRMVHQYMGVSDIDQIALDDLPRAVEYVHRLALGSVDDQQAQNNAFWRQVGILEYSRLRQDLDAILQATEAVSRALYNLSRDNGLIYDALAEQQIKFNGKHDWQDTHNQARQFIQRQKNR